MQQHREHDGDEQEEIKPNEGDPGDNTPPADLPIPGEGDAIDESQLGG